MSKTWNLDRLYPAIESEAYQQDMKKLKEMVQSFDSFVDEVLKDENHVVANLEEYVTRMQEYSALARKLGGYVSLLTSANTNDELATKQMDVIDNILNQSVKAMTKINAWIGRLDLDVLCNQSDLLKEHAFVLKEIKEQAKHQLSENEEMIIASMKQTGSNAFARLKDQLIGGHTVEIETENGVEKMPLTMVLNMAYATSTQTRKKAYEAEIASYAKIENSLAACLNGIKGEVLTTSKMHGFDSPLAMTLFDSRMDKETLDVMLEAIKEALPKFREYMKAKAKYLGYEHGLPFYEMYAPVTENEKAYTYQEGCEFILKHFKSFDETLYQMAKTAIENDWIDVDSRPGKVGGAFCAGVPSLKESRILLNFSHSFDSVVTLAHELGHAFHNECAKNESILNTDSPMPLAETASTFNETIVKKAALKELSDKEALSVLEAEISGNNQVIVDIYSRFLFESNFFEARKNGPLSAREICNLMSEAQKESYGDGLDETALHPYMWTWKPHYYYADANFYNFPYAFGQLFAKGLYAIYLEKGESFIPEYKKLLASTGKMSIYEAAQSVDIDIHDIAFWNNSFKMMFEDIDTFIQLLAK